VTVTAGQLASFDRTITLATGQRIRLRPISPEDEPRLIALYERLSRRTVYQRFFTVMRRLPPDWVHFLANVDYHRRFALVAEDAAAAVPTLVAVARYEPVAGEDDVVELAFVVQDAWQGRGLGSLLVRELLRAAELNGFVRYRAYVLGDNRRMLTLLARYADVRERHVDQGVIELTLTRRRTPPPGG
jgi:RimJ/RimL family protein N-acetyltransferase